MGVLKSHSQGLSGYTLHTPPLWDTQWAHMRQQGFELKKKHRVGRIPADAERYIWAFMGGGWGGGGWNYHAPGIFNFQATMDAFWGGFPCTTPILSVLNLFLMVSGTHG